MPEVTDTGTYIELAGRLDSQFWHEDTDDALINIALGLCGEAGEFADHVKKSQAQGHKLDEDKLDLEAGDILWYLGKWCRRRKKTFLDLMQMNVDKLYARYPEGQFSVERSVNRSK